MEVQHLMYGFYSQNVPDFIFKMILPFPSPLKPDTTPQREGTARDR